MLRFGEDRNSLATLSGVLVGMGEVLGGIIFGFMGHMTIKRGRDPIVMIGFVVSMVAYFLMFINIAPNAPLNETDDIGFISPNITPAIFTSFLLGFSDACFMTQVCVTAIEIILNLTTTGHIHIMHTPTAHICPP